MPKYRLGRLRGEYAAVSYDPDGKRHRNTLGTDNKVAAQAAIDKLNAEVERAPGQTVQMLWDAYRDEKKDHWGRLLVDATKPWGREPEFERKRLRMADQVRSEDWFPGR